MKRYGVERYKTMAGHRSPTTFNAKAFTVLVIVVLIAAGIAVYQVRNTRVFVDATTHQPERYTELYFNDPTTLPSTVARGTKLSVGFSAHNVEARGMNYTYTISYITNKGAVLATEQGGFRLSNGSSKTITNDITIPKTYSGAAEIQVELTNINQSIHFWVQSR